MRRHPAIDNIAEMASAQVSLACVSISLEIFSANAGSLFHNRGLAEEARCAPDNIMRSIDRSSKLHLGAASR